MPEYSWEDFKNKLQMMEEQGGPLPSAWSPEAIAEAQRRADMMGIAEFRPATGREVKLSRLAEIATGNRYGKDRIAKMPLEAREKAKQKILKEFSPDEWTNQVEDMTSGSAKSDVFGEGKVLDRILQNLKNERTKDFAEAGYDSPSFRTTGGMGTLSWGNMNKVASKKPEFVYHSTPEPNISSIGESGLLPAKVTGKAPNFLNETGPKFPEQMDKVFFSENPKTIEKLLGRDKVQSRSLRTKYDPKFKPDIHQDEDGAAWWQTRDRVPPQNLEIETAPGQWQNLIDYMKSRGGK
jgi:hypothetical protein